MIGKLPRCPTCSGVAQGSMMSIMAKVAMIRQMLTQLSQVGVPDSAMADVRTWTDENFRQCTCARTGAAFFG